MKAITREVTIIPMFCKRIVERSTTIVRSRVASVSRRDDSIALVLLISSNQPISFLKIAGNKEFVQEHISAKDHDVIKKHVHDFLYSSLEGFSIFCTKTLTKDTETLETASRFLGQIILISTNNFQEETFMLTNL